MPKPKNRAAIFARYSSSLQSDLSLEAQVSEIEKFCQREGLEITHRFLLPETRSAHVEKSEGFQDMVRAAKRGEFDSLVVHKIDRFTRDRDTAVAYKALLRRHKVQFRSVSENLGDSIYDRMIEGFLEVIAEFYSLNLAAETKKGQRAAVRAGRWKGGAVPFGYQKGTNSAGHSVLELHPVNSTTVRDAFEMYANGMGTSEILDHIENVTGKRWLYPTLQSRLKNPTYIGRLEYGKTSLDAKGNRTINDPEDVTVGECVAIVSQELWEQVRERMGRASFRNGVRNYDYLLTEGLMSCAACGRSVVGMCSGRDMIPYYRCSGWRDKTCPVKKKRSTRAEDLEEQFVKAIREQAKDSRLKVQAEIFASVEDSRKKFAEKERSALTERIEKIESQKSNLLELVMEGGADLPTVSKKMSELEEESDSLKIALAEVEKKIARDSSKRAEETKVWYESMLDMLHKSHFDPAWKRAVRSLFDLEWDFEQKKGTLYSLPFEGETPVVSSFRDDGSTEMIRSTSINARTSRKRPIAALVV